MKLEKESVQQGAASRILGRGKEEAPWKGGGEKEERFSLGKGRGMRKRDSEEDHARSPGTCKDL